jgi:hypothetical protein
MQLFTPFTWFKLMTFLPPDKLERSRTSSGRLLLETRGVKPLIDPLILRMTLFRLIIDAKDNDTGPAASLPLAQGKIREPGC